MAWNRGCFWKAFSVCSAIFVESSEVQDTYGDEDLMEGDKQGHVHVGNAGQGRKVRERVAPSINPILNADSSV